MQAHEFNYHLPPERIALYPAEPRDKCKLIVINRKESKIEHRIFSEIGGFFKSGDCLVLNLSKVHPVRFRLRRKTGGVVELLFTERMADGKWLALARPAKKLRIGERLVDENREEIVEIAEINKGKLLLNLLWEEQQMFARLGMAPLPGYIQRMPEEKDIETYQAVFAETGFSIAAPTAGLHFTRELLSSLQHKGVEAAYIQLDVGEGTFRPVKTDRIEDHIMLAENYTISTQAAEKINQAKRVIAVGTTVTRTLESFPADQPVMAGSGSTDLYIYPGHQFRHVDLLLTNFHQPCSTPLLLTAAFTEKDLLFTAYQQALARDYSFLSYGDAMLII
jgi:S-adenosylmethionine:tRNA ribosyltransferase-isomerase